MTAFKIYEVLKNILVPSLRYSQYFYEQILNDYVGKETIWLDLGCGHQILPEWRSKEEKEMVSRCKMIAGIDYNLNSLRNNKIITHKLRGDISSLPFKGNSFDLISSNMVVEHLSNPKIQFKEINRILKPNGIFIFHTPNALSYITILGKVVTGKLKRKIIFILEGRKEEDIFKTYYRVNTHKSITHLGKETGFEISKIKMIVTSPQFAVIPPLMLIELIWIRILMMNVFKKLRTNIIAILEKQEK